MTDTELIRRALEARRLAWCPYSGFAVGAALLCSDGTVFTGCNIENSSLGATNCAERTAIFSAVAAGHRDFSAIAICGGPAGSAPSVLCPPCGICRQVMTEFCSPDFRVILAVSAQDFTVSTLSALLPSSFGPADLGK